MVHHHHHHYQPLDDAAALTTTSVTVTLPGSCHCRSRLNFKLKKPETEGLLDRFPETASHQLQVRVVQRHPSPRHQGSRRSGSWRRTSFHNKVSAEITTSYNCPCSPSSCATLDRIAAGFDGTPASPPHQKTMSSFRRLHQQQNSTATEKLLRFSPHVSGKIIASTY